MRVAILSLFCLFVAEIGVLAQNTVNPDAYRNSPLMERTTRRTDKAIAAINEYATRKPSKKPQKKIKVDPELANPLGSKSFDGAGSNFHKTSSSMDKGFSYDQKSGSASYRGTRKFLGIKNPWFGKKIYTTDSSALWNKSDFMDESRKYGTRSMETKANYEAEKSASSRKAATNTFVPRGRRQGEMDEITDSKKKKMTVEDVRELLNKNQ